MDKSGKAFPMPVVIGATSAAGQEAGDVETFVNELRTWDEGTGREFTVANICRGIAEVGDKEVPVINFDLTCRHPHVEESEDVFSDLLIPIGCYGGAIRSDVEWFKMAVRGSGQGQGLG